MSGTLTRIQNNQITDATIQGTKLANNTLTGGLFATNLTLNSNVTILGNLTVANSTTSLNSINTYINDPVIVFNNNYTGSISNYDIGFLINRNLSALAPYGSVNVFFGWQEADQAIEAFTTTDTGTGITSLNNSGYANVRFGNATLSSATITGSFTTQGTANFGALAASSFQGVIGNITPNTFTFTTGNIIGLQAVAIGNINPGTGAFTTVSTGSLQGIIGNVTPNSATFTTVSTGSLQGIIGNVTPNSATFTTVSTGGLQASAIGNVTPGTAVFTTLSATGVVTANTTTNNQYYTTTGAGQIALSSGTTGTINNFNIGATTPGTGAFTALTATSFQGVIGNVTPSTATFTTANTGGLQATAIGNVTPGTAAFTTLSASGQTTLANATTGGLQATAIGNVTPGTAVFTTLSATGVVTANTTTNNQYYTTTGAGQIAISSGTTGTINNMNIGATTPGTGAFTTATTTGTIVSGGNIVANSGTTSTSITTGAIILPGSGGIGLGGNVWAGGTANFGGGGNFGGSILPTANVAYDLGSSTLQWRDIWMSGNTLHIGGVNVTANVTNGVTISAAINGTPIGNVTPSTGAFTNLSATGQVTLGNTTVTGLQAIAIGNATPGTAQFTTLGASGASTLNTVTANALQSVAIGNVTPGTAAFTTLSATGQTTLANATTGGLQAVAIGNTTPGTASFTALTATGALTFNTTTNNQSLTTTGAGTITISSGTLGSINNMSIGGMTAAAGAFTTLSATGASTLNTVTANGLQAVAIGNATPGTAAFTTLTASGATTLTNTTNSISTGSGALIISGGLAVQKDSFFGGNVNIGGNLTITGNTVSIGASTLSVTDPIINLNTPTDLTPLLAPTVSDIGLKFHYYDYADTAAFLGRATDTGYLEWYSRGSDTANVFVGTVYGTMKPGALVLANSRVVGGGLSANTGALQVWGDGSITGNLYVGGTQTVAGNLTSGNSSTTNSTVTNNLYVGGTINGAFVGTITGGAAQANIALMTYQQVNSTNNTFYVNFGANSITSNSNVYVNSSLSYFASNGQLNATTFSGAVVATTITASSTLNVTGATTATTISTGGLQAVAIGNVTPGTAAFTTATANGLQAVAIGNTTPGTATFTTLSATGVVTANTTTNNQYYTTTGAGQIALTSGTTGTINNFNIGGTTAGTGAFTTITTTGTITSGGNIVANSGTASTSTTTGALIVNGGTGVSGNAYVGGVVYGGPVQSTVGLTNPLAVFTGSYNNYAQVQIQNTNTGTNVSADFVATAPNGTDTANYIDMGINGNNYSVASWTISGANDGYLYVDGGNLTVGTDTVGKSVAIHIGGTYANNVVATFNANNTQPTSATTGTMVINGGVGISGTIYASGNAIVGNLITTGTSGNISGVNYVFANAATITGQLSTNTLVVSAGIQGTPIGNATPSTAVFTYANAAAIQATAIGNITPGTGAFTTLSVQNVTDTGNLTVGGSLQATAIGNITPGSGAFTSLSATTGITGTLQTAAQTNITTVGTLNGLTVSGGATSLSATTATSLNSTPIGATTPSTGAFTTITSTSTIVSAGNVVANSGTNSTSPTTGALIVNGGVGVSANVFFGNALTVNSTQTAASSFIVKGVNDSTLVWARPNATYDQLLLGGNATVANLVAGAKLQINSVDSMIIPSGTTTQRPGALGYTDTAGMFRFNSTTKYLEWYDGTTWNSTSAPTTVIVTQQFNGDGSTTAFLITAIGSVTTTTAATLVDINGVLQIGGSSYAYTITGGNTVTFTQAPQVGDVIDVRVLTTSKTVNSMSSSSSFAQIQVDDTAGILFYAGVSSPVQTFTMSPGGGIASNDANVVISSANVATTIDSYTAYRGAKYLVQASNAGNYQMMEVLVSSNGTVSSVVGYGTVQTSGNLGVVAATASAGTTTLQFIATNTNTNVRVFKQYMLP